MHGPVPVFGVTKGSCSVAIASRLIKRSIPKRKRERMLFQAWLWLFDSFSYWLEMCHVEPWVCITESPLWGVCHLFCDEVPYNTIKSCGPILYSVLCIMHSVFATEWVWQRSAFCILYSVFCILDPTPGLLVLAKVCILYSVFCILKNSCARKTAIFIPQNTEYNLLPNTL